jgi:hypothetical protein
VSLPGCLLTGRYRACVTVPEWTAADYPALDWNEPDDVLAQYVETVNQAQEPVAGGLAITLTVRGTVVTGELIPNWQWFDEVAHLSGGQDSVYFELARALKEYARAMSEAVEARSAGADLTVEQREALATRTAYIHLRNARLARPALARRRPHYWRGRLSDVSGWSVGGD